MLGLALGVILAFVIGLFVKARFQPTNLVLARNAGVAVAIGLIAGIVGYLVLDLRGAELILTAMLWALLLPAVLLGNVVRERMKPKMRL